MYDVICKKRNRVLIITDDFPPIEGGISTYAYELAKSSNNEFDFLAVLTSKEENSDKFDTDQDFTIHRMPVPRFFRHNYKIKILITTVYSFYYCRKYSIKAIHTMTWIPYGVSAYVLTRIIKVPYYVTAHGLEVLEPQKSKFRNKIMKIVLSNSQKVAVNSNYTKTIVARLGIPSQKIQIIPPGVDTTVFTGNSDGKALYEKYDIGETKIILTVGRLVERKGIDMVIKALSKVINQIPNVVYLVVGTGPDKKRLKDLVQNLGLEKNVIFAGYVESKDLVSYYNICDLFIMPSREIEKSGDVEGFGIVYLEANACGKPVIGGRSGGIQDAIIHGETGLLVNPTNVDEIAEAIFKILKNEHYARYLGLNGLERAKNNFDWKQIAKLEKEMITNHT